MNHDENTLILSYYILDIIPSCSSEYHPQQQQQQQQRSTNYAVNDIIISTTTTTTTTTKRNNSCKQSTTALASNANAANINTFASQPAPRKTYNYPENSVDSVESERMIPWIVDEWSVHDEEKAATILNDAAVHCRITEQDYKTKQFRYIKNDTMAWNKFYQSHQNNFFKDRHYFVKEFPLEFTVPERNSTTGITIIGDDSHDTSPQYGDTNETTTLTTTPTLAVTNCSNVHRRCLVEIGCGVGNAMLPLLSTDRCIDDDNHSHNNNNRVQQDVTYMPQPANQQQIEWTVYGFDLSSTAIDILRNDSRYQHALKEHRTRCDVSDISIPNILPSYVHHVANVTSLIFCLSAIHPMKHSIVLQNVISTLQPGTGVLIFRDYGRYDLAQIKLGKQRSKLLDTDNFYRKHDGTKCYYFTIQDIERLIQQSDGTLEILELQYIRRKYINRSMQDGERRRVWVQGRFRRTTKSVDFVQ